MIRTTQSAPALNKRRVDGRRASFFMGALLWLIWVPASFVLLILVLENFVLSDFLF